MLKLSLYSSWDDAVGADAVRSLDLAASLGTSQDGKELINYLLDTTNSTAYYEGVGVFEGQPVDLTKCGEIQSAAVSWAESKPTGTAVVVEVSIFDGAAWGDWQPVTSGGAIPGLTIGLDLTGYKIKYRAKLSTTNLSNAPGISQIKLTITSRKLFRVFSTGTVKAKADIVPTAVEQL